MSLVPVEFVNYHDGSKVTHLVNPKYVIELYPYGSQPWVIIDDGKREQRSIAQHSVSMLAGEMG